MPKPAKNVVKAWECPGCHDYGKNRVYWTNHVVNNDCGQAGGYSEPDQIWVHKSAFA